MLKNYLKIALRNLRRRAFFSTLNVGGLALGMAACLLIFQYVAFEYSFDTFHEREDQLYRLTIGDEGAPERRANMWFAVGPVVAEATPEVRTFTRWHPGGVATVARMEETGPGTALRADELIFADPAFFTMFSFPLVQGDTETALAEPGSAVITESLARRLFGDADPMGQILEVGSSWTQGPYAVRGIAADVPANSHLQFDLLLPMQDLLQNNQYRTSDGWSWNNFYTYVHLHDDADPSEAAQKMSAVVNQRGGALIGALEAPKAIRLQPSADVHLFSDFGPAQGAYRSVAFFSLLALFILIIAWINYINLSTARATERAKEVGLRKTVGAARRQLVTQFLFESALLNGLAFVLAVALAALGLPYVQEIAGLNIPWSIWSRPAFWLGFTGIWLVGVVLASLYPAFVLSRFQPAVALKGAATSPVRQVWLRKGLTVFQFAASVALLVSTVVVYAQVQHLRRLDLGMDLARTLIVERPQLAGDAEGFLSGLNAFTDALQQQPAVEGVATSGAVPGRGFNFSTTSFRRQGDSNSDGRLGLGAFVHPSFVDVYGLEMVAGRRISEDREADFGDAVLINETAVRTYGFASAEEVVGQQLVYGRPADTLRVVGVVKDFHWFSGKQEIEPYVLIAQRRFGRFFSIKVQGANLASTVADVRRLYERSFPGNPFEYAFADAAFEEQYRADQRFGALLGLFAGLALVVALLGLVGLAAYATASRAKEISIRKVFGASVPELVRLLASDFTVLVATALVVALPLTYVAAQAWLSEFASRIDLTLGLFLLPSLAVLVTALTAVSFHAVKAAMVDPVKSLRYE